MPQDLQAALAEVRALLLDRDGLRRAVAAGRRRGAAPSVVRAELRPVELNAGARLQVVTSDGVRPYTRNVTWDGEAGAVVDGLLAEPFGNWHVETAAETLQLRVTKKGGAQLHRTTAAAATSAKPLAREPLAREPLAHEPLAHEPLAHEPLAHELLAHEPLAHDRQPEHVLDPGDPLFDTIGGSAAKRRQVDAFLRALAATLDDDLPSPLRVVDLGCGNAYLTFAAFRLLRGRGLDVRLIGVDVRADQRERNGRLAEQLGWAVQVRFIAGTIAQAPVDGADVVLALHACDTATDEALARAVRWKARYVLAAPCCHNDLATQLRGSNTALTRHPILRERFADVLTDSLRAALLRLHGYRVDVVEFVDSRHTPRNVLLRARHTGAGPTQAQRTEYAALIRAWNVMPALDRLLSYTGPAPGDGPSSAARRAAASTTAHARQRPSTEPPLTPITWPVT